MANVHVGNDSLNLQREIAKEARSPEYIAATIEHFKAFGMHIVVTDGALVAVSRDFETFVKEHAPEFPKLKEFLSRWKGYHQTWTGLMRQTRDFATATSNKYLEYDKVYLDLVQHLETKQDIKDAVEALTQFSKQSDPSIPMDFFDKFRELFEQLNFFTDDLDGYLQKPLPQEVKELEAKLKAAVATVSKCDQVIHNAAESVKFIPLLAFLSNNAAFEATISEAIKKRNAALADADRYEKELEAIKERQASFHLLIQFFLVNSNLQRIGGPFIVALSSSWRFFHIEALQLANILKDVEDVSQIPEVFKITVELARAVATPFQHGLDALAQAIVT